MMNRRDLLNLVALALSARTVPVAASGGAAVVVERRDRLKAAALPAVPICRADGKAFILGVATESVCAGDFVQIQIQGPATIRVQ